MSHPHPSRTIAMGLVGAVAGGALGYVIFFWMARQGFYALALPPAMLGLGAGLCARRRSMALAVVCGIGALVLGLLTEWRFAPFIADSSLDHFITHIHQLKPMTLIMLAVGTVIGFILALGRR